MNPNQKMKLSNEILPIHSIEDIDIISLNKIWEIKDGTKILVHNNPENLITYRDENNLCTLF